MEVTKDPQAMSNNYFIAVDHLEWGETKVARFPSDFSETPASWRRRAPRFGEHTNEIPSELGYLADEIKTLKKEGIIL
jgi:formyl-CoA transferase